MRDTFTDLKDLSAKVLASLSRYEKRKTVLQAPVDSLRIQLGEGRVALFHNDRPIGTSFTALDSSFRHAVEEYHRGKSPSAFLTTKDGAGGAVGAVEILADRMGRRLGELLIAGGAVKNVGELISEWQASGTKAQVALREDDAPWAKLWILWSACPT